MDMDKAKTTKKVTKKSTNTKDGAKKTAKKSTSTKSNTQKTPKKSASAKSNTKKSVNTKDKLNKSNEIKTIKTTKKVEEPTKLDERNITNAGIVILFIALLGLIIFFIAGGFWSVKLSAIPIFTNNTKINGSGFNAEFSESSEVDADKLFESKYFNALNLLSDSIAFGTTWLGVCENGQITYNNDIYVKVCSDEFKSLDDIYNKFLVYISKSYIDELVGDNFIEKDGSLYIKPVWINKNNEYIGFDSYRIEEKSSDKIVYIVKSKYGKLNCTDNCNYSYSENRFSLVREENRWVVSNFEMPY